jgi:ribosomal protein S24E
MATTTTSTGLNQDLLDSYEKAAQEKSERTGKPSASRAQIAKLLTLIGEENASRNDRINTRTALQGGVSKAHASVLIDKLQGTFGQKRAPVEAPVVPTAEPTQDDIEAAIAAAMAVENDLVAEQPVEEEFLPWNDPAFAS